MRNREHSDGTEPDPLPDNDDNKYDDEKADDAKADDNQGGDADADQGGDADDPNFDASSLPHFTESHHNPYSEYFQFAPGSNYFY